MQIEMKPWAAAALGGAAVCWGVQTWSGLKLVKAYEKLAEDFKEVSDQRSRSAYTSIFLLVKLVESGVELDDFERQVLFNPPRLHDKDLPTLFDAFFTSENLDEAARELFERLREAREADGEN